MLHCLNTSGNLVGTCSDMIFLDHQQLQHHRQGYFSSETGFNGVLSTSMQVQNSQGLMMLGGDSGSTLGEVVAHSMKPDPVLENRWPELGKFEMPGMGFGSSGLPTGPAPAPGFDANSAMSRTYSCPPTLDAKGRARDSVSMTGKMNSSSRKESFKKRKAEKSQNPKVVEENDNKDKRIKVGVDEGESKITGQTSTKINTTTTTNNNRETCADTSKENSNASDVQKPDYIHVRARRGQATDSHSLAERVRREKIGERMKYLQDLVPGCNKISGKAGMLDEIINYVQALQRQVEFLSMKLAAVNPMLDFNIDDLFAKEVFPASAASFPAIGMSSDMTNPAYLQFNSAQQIFSGCALDAGINTPDMGLRRTTSAPVSMPETYLDSSCFTQILPSSTWESDLQSLYNVAFDEARATTFPTHIFTGLVEASNLTMEM